MVQPYQLYTLIALGIVALTIPFIPPQKTREFFKKFSKKK